MKSIALIALLGLVSYTDNVQAVQRYYPGVTFVQNSEQSSSSSSSSDSDSDVGLESEINAHPIATKWDKKHPHPGYQANHDDFEGLEGFGKYDRQVPAHFDGPGSGDDQFMNSMITKYAVEEATPEGKPTGSFVFKYANAKQAAYEIVGTHLGLHGKEAEGYLAKYFDKTWKHFDAAGDGRIEAARMSGFYRFLCGNMQITLH